MTSAQATVEGKRTAELSVDVKASTDAVWKALTDADELTRWFPLDAKVTPGMGGKIWCSWGPEAAWESPITIWEPKKRLRVLWCPAETPEADLFGVDYYIEDRGGGVTRLRLVHFGFSKDAQWDQMYDGVSRGWDFMLWGLKGYLEEHQGVARNVVFLNSKMGDQTREQAWDKVFGAGGVLPDAGLKKLKVGDRFKVKVGGEELSGVVRVQIPGKDFQAVIGSLNGANLRVQIDQCKTKPGDEVSITLASFGVESDQRERVAKALGAGLERGFGKVEEHVGGR